MDIKLPYNVTVTIRSPRQRETIIEIDNNGNDLRDSLFSELFQDNSKNLYDLLDEKQEELHDYLTSRGYIFNKA